MTEVHRYYMKTGINSKNQFKVGKCNKLKISTNDTLRKYAIYNLWRAPDIEAPGIYIYNIHHWLNSISRFDIYVSTDADILGLIKQHNYNQALTLVLVKIYCKFKKLNKKMNNNLSN